jgi:hypothetical protein
MRGTLPRGRWNPLILVSVVVLLTITVGVVVYQQVIQREDDIPGSAGGVGEPAGDRGVQVGGGLIAQWAGAAAAGDYAAARRVMEDDPLQFGMWKDWHDDFQQKIVGYTILNEQSVGQTTTARVRFEFPNNDATCVDVLVDNVTQRLRVDSGYVACPGQVAP